MRNAAVDLAPTGDLTLDTAVTQTAPDCFDALIRDGYGAGAEVPNGGLLLSVATRAMAHASGRPSLLTVTGHYMRRTHPGTATIDVDVLRRGRMVMTRAALRQGGELALHATGVFADRSMLPQRTWLRMSPPELPDPDACVSTDDLPGVSELPPIFWRMEHRIPRDQLRYVPGNPGTDAEIVGWYRPRAGRADEAAVPFLMDAMYPPVYAIGLQDFAPTIELSVQVRRPPDDGWMRYRFATRAIAGGVMEEDGQLWTAGGDLVALSRQTALPSDGSG
jgi:acyl-CoA thioesterase